MLIVTEQAAHQTHLKSLGPVALGGSELLVYVHYYRH